MLSLSVVSDSLRLRFLHTLDCSLPDFSVHEIFQARILEWVAISLSRGSSWPRDRTCISCVSCTAGRFFTRQVIRKSYIFINNYFKCHWAIHSNPNRVAEWINNQAPTICCLQETYLRAKETHRLKVRGWKKIFQVNGNSKKAEVTILISDKTDFKTKAIIKIKKGTI